MEFEEALIFQMNKLIDEINEEGLIMKIEDSQKLIWMLYVYLRKLGVSNEEMTNYYAHLKEETKS